LVSYASCVVVTNLFFMIHGQNLPHEPEFTHRFSNKAPDENFIAESYKRFFKIILGKYQKQILSVKWATWMRLKNVHPGGLYYEGYCYFMLPKDLHPFFCLQE
jgi:hypothetical protein